MAREEVMTEEQLKRDAETRELEAWKENQRYLMDTMNKISLELSELKKKHMCLIYNGEKFSFVWAGFGCFVGVFLFDLLKYLIR